MPMSQTIEFNVFRGSENGEIIPDTVRRTIQPREVFVEISHAGLCGTDRHYKRRPIVLGHEGAGVVRDVGSAATLFHPGDKVGFGWVQKVCGHCDYCITDKDQYCVQRQQYGTHDFEIGSFATHAVWDESMLIKLPETLELEYAAPLMCGGATVWSALTSYDLRPGDRVAVQGLGGLGHMAIQFAAALGCDVVVLSTSPEKREEALAFGAKEFHVLRDGVPQTPYTKVKHLLLCGSAAPDLAKVLDLVAYDGTVYALTISGETPPLPMLPLVTGGIRIQGSAVASRLAIRRMLRFATLHGIRPVIMTWPMTIDGMQAAFQKLEAGKMRYRGVLVSQRFLMGKPVVEKMK